MIKQDYILRMIQEIISAIADVLLKRKKLTTESKTEYDCITGQILGCSIAELSVVAPEELINKYSNTEDGIDKLELIAVSMLITSEETEKSNLLLKFRLKQNGTHLLQYVQHNSKRFSLQRELLINMIK